MDGRIPNGISVRVDPKFYELLCEINFQNGQQIRRATEEIAGHADIIKKLLNDKDFELKIRGLLK